MTYPILPTPLFRLSDLFFLGICSIFGFLPIDVWSVADFLSRPFNKTYNEIPAEVPDTILTNASYTFIVTCSNFGPFPFEKYRRKEHKLKHIDKGLRVP